MVCFTQALCIVAAAFAPVASGIETCVVEGRTCAGPGLPDLHCCSGLLCERHLLGTANSQCVRPAPQCVPRGQQCACAGCRQEACCDGAQCLQTVGGGGKAFCISAGEALALKEANTSSEPLPEPSHDKQNMTTERSGGDGAQGPASPATHPKVVAAAAAATSACSRPGDRCSMFGIAAPTCCSGAQCTRLGFLNWRCSTHGPQCVPEGDTCGGPGIPQEPCCRGLRCQRHLLGTANLQCVRPDSQCKHHGEQCGCAGCLTQPCCGAATCRETIGGGGRRYCVAAAHLRGVGDGTNSSASIAQGQAPVDANTTEASR
mmetsp:Transcript_41595/g.125956  ORF Transcript_41595/g.125956 Transcript_41595/m.125956 type:complete len:317 (+) Transcript_41595:91-1041(+)